MSFIRALAIPAASRCGRTNSSKRVRSPKRVLLLSRSYLSRRHFIPGRAVVACGGIISLPRGYCSVQFPSTSARRQAWSNG